MDAMFFGRFSKPRHWCFKLRSWNRVHFL